MSMLTKTQKEKEKRGKKRVQEERKKDWRRYGQIAVSSFFFVFFLCHLVLNSSMGFIPRQIGQ